MRRLATTLTCLGLGLAGCGGGSAATVTISVATVNPQAAGSGADTASGATSDGVPTVTSPSRVSSTTQAAGASTARSTAAGAHTTTATAPSAATAAFPRLLPAALGTGPTGGFKPAVSWQGTTIVTVDRASGVTMLAFDQHHLILRLHSGTVDAGPTGWRWGSAVLGAEQRALVAAFNGGFKFVAGAGGFMSYGRVGSPLHAGLASIVTYTNGTTDIGAWNMGVPAPGLGLVSVRQNLYLLVSHGHLAADAGCISCWGATLGGVSAPARSALGITANGTLIWAGGESLTPAQLGMALIGAGVVRAAELDINPEWVAAYLYGRRGGPGPLAPVGMVAGQHGIPGSFLIPYNRDFFSVDLR